MAVAKAWIRNPWPSRIGDRVQHTVLARLNPRPRRRHAQPTPIRLKFVETLYSRDRLDAVPRPEAAQPTRTAALKEVRGSRERDARGCLPTSTPRHTIGSHYIRAGLTSCCGLPLAGDDPFIMHYEPQDSPVRNRLHRQQRSPSRKVYEHENKRYHPDPDEPGADVFPYGVTTYRLTEHFTAGGMSRVGGQSAEGVR